MWTELQYLERLASKKMMKKNLRKLMHFQYCKQLLEGPTCTTDSTETKFLSWILKSARPPPCFPKQKLVDETRATIFCLKLSWSQNSKHHLPTNVSKNINSRNQEEIHAILRIKPTWGFTKIVNKKGMKRTAERFFFSRLQNDKPKKIQVV